jgi:hypothetical protein
MTQTMPTPTNNNPATEPSTDKYNGPQPGVYKMRATDAELGYTNGTEAEPPKPQVGVLLEFSDGPYKGTSLTWYGFFTDKTRAGTIRALRTLGWAGDDLSDLSSVRGEAPCTIQTEPDLEGVVRARVRFIGGGTIAMKTTMSDDQKKAFAASMKAFASTIKADAPEAPAPGAPANGPTAPAGQKFF